MPPLKVNLTQTGDFQKLIFIVNCEASLVNRTFLSSATACSNRRCRRADWGRDRACCCRGHRVVAIRKIPVVSNIFSASKFHLNITHLYV